MVISRCEPVPAAGAVVRGTAGFNEVHLVVEFEPERAREHIRALLAGVLLHRPRRRPARQLDAEALEVARRPAERRDPGAVLVEAGAGRLHRRGEPGWSFEQVAGAHPERLGEGEERADGRLPIAALDAGQVRGRQPRQPRQPVDAEAAALPEDAQPLADGIDLRFDAGGRHSVSVPAATSIVVASEATPARSLGGVGGTAWARSIIDLSRMAELARSVRNAVRGAQGAGPGPLAATLTLSVVNGVLPVARLVAVAHMVATAPQVLRDGTSSPAADRLVTAAFAFVAVIGVGGLARPVIAATADHLARQIDGRLRERVVRMALRPRTTAFLDDAELRRVFDDAKGVTPAMGFTPGRFAALLPSVLGSRVLVVGLVAGLFVVDWRLGLVFLVTQLKLEDEMQKVRGRMLAGAAAAPKELGYDLELATTCAPAKEVRVFGLGRWLLDRYESGTRDHMLGAWSSRRDFTPSLIAVLVWIAVLDVVALVLLANGATGGDVTLAELTFALTAIMALNPTGAVNQDDVLMSFAAASIGRIAAAEAALATGDANTPTGTVPPGPLAVRFAGVTYRYPGTDRDVLAGVDVELRSGERVAIVGKNGAGKTTLVRLLCGLIQPTAGGVSVNGADLDGLDPTSWRRQLAVLFQDYVRYPVTARDNVRFGAIHWQPADLHEQIDEVAALTGARTRIGALPNGWDATLSPELSGGESLSGGEWQRLALARSLLSVAAGARVLVLDEPTAALDVRGEAELFDVLVQSLEGDDDVLTVFVSHRFSTVRQADRILVVDDGRIVEDGDHDALVAAGGLYAQMFRAQAQQFVRTKSSEVDA